MGLLERINKELEEKQNKEPVSKILDSIKVVPPIQTNSMIDLMIMDGQKGMLNHLFFAIGESKPLDESSLNGLGVPLVTLRGFYDFFDPQDISQPHPEIGKLLTDLDPETVVFLYGAEVLAMEFDPNINLAKHPRQIFRQVLKLRKAVDYRYKDKQTRLTNVRFKHLHPAFFNKERTIEAFFKKRTGSTTFISCLKEDTNNEFFANVRLNDVGLSEDSSTMLSNYFGIDDAEAFYDIYNPHTGIGNRRFIFGQHFWQYDRGELRRGVHVESLKFIQLADKYVKLNVNKLGPLNDIRVVEMQSYGVDALKAKYCKNKDYSFLYDIAYYEGLTLEPDNTLTGYRRDYKIREKHLEYTYYNVYEPMTIFPDVGKTKKDCPYIIDYLKHLTQGKADVDNPIEGDRFTLFLDWMIIAYRYPKIRLPMVIFLSKSRGTGKSTILELMAYIYGSNALKTNMEDLLGKFNSHNAYKTYVLLEETKMEGDRDVHMDILKDLITGKTRLLEPKGLPKFQVSNYAHFIAASNHEEEIMKIDSPDEDRFFFMQPPKLSDEQKDPNLLRKMKDEVPAFLNLLMNTEIHHKNKNPRNPRDISDYALDRLWFKGKHIRTDEFYRIIEKSKPFVEREVDSFMKDLFLTYKIHSVRIHPVVLSDLLKGQTKYYHSPEDIKRVFKQKGYDAMTSNPSVIQIPIGFDWDEINRRRCYRYYVERIKNTQNYQLPKKRYWECLAEDWLSPTEWESLKIQSLDDIEFNETEPVTGAKITLNGNAQQVIFDWLLQWPMSERFVSIGAMRERLNEVLTQPIEPTLFTQYLKDFHDWKGNQRAVSFKAADDSTLTHIKIQEPF